jgi:circadian clock protein KaiB
MPLLVRLRLYVAADALHSTRALSNLREALKAGPPGRHHLEVVDVIRHPERALDDGVLLTPTLVKLAPGPPLHLVGDLHDTRALLRVLQLEAD